MKRQSGVFDFKLFTPDHDGKHLPFFPFVDLFLSEIRAHSDGRYVLSEELASELEIDTRIQALKHDLDAAGERAKQALAQARRKEAARARG